MTECWAHVKYYTPSPIEHGYFSYTASQFRKHKMPKSQAFLSNKLVRFKNKFYKYEQNGARKTKPILEPHRIVFCAFSISFLPSLAL